MKKAAVILVAVVLMAGTVFPALAKTGAVTYFGDEWPINFLNSEHAEAEADFARIRADGFDTVIYCIPWREVQPDLYGDFNETSLSKIDQMIARAEICGLKVMLRLGYTWDMADSTDVTVRFREVFTDPGVRDAWLSYAQKIFQISSAHGNFAGAFITWEDFWDSLSEVASDYGERDRMLLKLLADTQTVFPDLSMECRLHQDPVNGDWYSHDATFGCANASYSSAMLAVSMGWPDDTVIGTQEALAMSSLMIGRMQAAGKPVFIDQFLYMETTPGYEHLAQAADVNSYLAGMGQVFRDSTIGYGIWTYRDYVNNVVYNPEFGLTSVGWAFDEASVENIGGNNKARISSGGSISQDFKGRGFSSSKSTKVRMLVDAQSDGIISVTVGTGSRIAAVHPGEQLIELSCPGSNQDSIVIRSNTDVYVDNVKVYTTVTGGNIYDINNDPGPYLPGIRALNQILCQ